MEKQLAEWKLFSEADIKSAKILLDSKENLYHISIYHAHQSVEKMMKAFLMKHKKDIPRTHNLS